MLWCWVSPFLLLCFTFYYCAIFLTSPSPKWAKCVEWDVKPCPTQPNPYQHYIVHTVDLTCTLSVPVHLGPQITCLIQLCHLHLLQLHLKPAVHRSLVFIQLCHLHLLQLHLKPAVHRSLVFIQLCHLHLLQLHLKPAVHISFPSIPGSLSSAGVHWDLEPVHFHSQLLQHRLFASFSRVPCCRFCPLGVCCNSLQAIVDKYAVSQKMCQPIVTIILSNLKQILKFFYCCKSVKVATKQCITLPPRLSSVAVLPRETWIFKFVAFFAYFTVFQYKAATKVQPN